jgi:hypothetical protein
MHYFVEAGLNFEEGIAQDDHINDLTQVEEDQS